MPSVSIRIFRWATIFIAFHILLVLITPLVTVKSLLYPLRIDSTYVIQMRNSGDTAFIGHPMRPEELGMQYQKIIFRRNGQPELRGWISYDSTRYSAPLLCIVPDISESKICYLNDVMEYHARGFHVCLIDMRGQGDSEGEFYDPGLNSALDLTGLVQRLDTMKRVEFVALLGVGTGAGICIKASVDTSLKASALVIQNAPQSLEKLFQKTVLHGWGGVLLPFLPVFKRSYERKTGLDFHEHRYAEIFKNSHLPYSSVAAGFVSKTTMEGIKIVHESGNYAHKKLFLELHPKQDNPFHQYSRKYYDQICGHIKASRQSPVFKSRRKKLASE
ncbi:MAG: serine aminopeptidase domain-containing protein [Bacteroidota bacterium]